jgi:hypothetical protein
VNAGLLSVERQGRGRYFRLAGPSVAEALEALARISPPEPIRSLRQGTRAHALRRARTCYNHLAGRLGVALMSAMLDQGLLTELRSSRRRQNSKSPKSSSVAARQSTPCALRNFISVAIIIGLQ